jgi:hypothetical protein
MEQGQIGVELFGSLANDRREGAAAVRKIHREQNLFKGKHKSRLLK